MKPIVLSMLISDNYYRDNQTGKSIISGTFNSIQSNNFPSIHGNCAIYMALTDIALDGELNLVFRHESGKDLLKLPAWTITAPDNRRAVVEIGGNISGLPLPSPDTYEFAAYWNSVEIFSRRLDVTYISKPYNDRTE